MVPYFLLLGCCGSKESGKLKNFVNCLGLENAILYLSDDLENYFDVINKLQNFGLLQNSIYDYNAIRSIISNLYAFLFPKIWDEDMYDKYLKFTVNHRNCRLYLRLDNTNKYCSSFSFKDKIIAPIVRSNNPLLTFKKIMAINCHKNNGKITNNT